MAGRFVCTTPSVQGVGESRGVSGDPEEAHHAHKVPGRYDEPKNQSATEEIWKRNAVELAKQIDELAREHSVKLIVLAGDVKARELIVGNPGYRRASRSPPCSSKTPAPAAPIRRAFPKAVRGTRGWRR